MNGSKRSQIKEAAVEGEVTRRSYKQPEEWKDRDSTNG